MSDVKKGFLIAIGVLVALWVISMAMGVFK